MSPETSYLRIYSRRSGAKLEPDPSYPPTHHEPRIGYRFQANEAGG